MIVCKRNGERVKRTKGRGAIIGIATERSPNE